MKNNEILKKKIIFRSTHRGTKEMDLLLGNFVKKNINLLNDAELKDLNTLLKADDEVLQKYYFNNTTDELIPNSKLLKKFKKHKI